MTDSRLERIDDLNWGRLNLVSAQDQVGEQHSWKVTFVQGDRVVRISCRALPDYCIPHGIDNDVTSALIDLYMSTGLPEDSELQLPVVELMQLAGFHRNGSYWARLLESLDRLHTTSYEISGGWRDHPNRRWTTAKFHFIESLEYTHQGESGRFDSRSMLRVRLAAQLTASLRSGYTKPLNIEFMQSLSRPRTRIIFRLLDAMRYDPEDPNSVVDAFEVGLIEWADQCKLPNTRPDVIRRALESPHEELLRRGYLRSVTFAGRGAKQRLRYEFAPEFTPISPTLLARFRTHGVADGVARQLTREFTASVLLNRIALFERLVATRRLQIKKTAAHALVHLIRHADQYPAPEVPVQPAEVVRAGRSPASAAVQRVAATVQPSRDQGIDFRTELEGKTREQAAAFVLKRLQLLYSKKFTTLDLDQLRHLLLLGEVEAVALLEEAHRRLVRLEAQQFVDELKSRLGHP